MRGIPSFTYRLVPAAIIALAGCTQFPAQVPVESAPVVTMAQSDMQMMVPRSMGGLTLAVAFDTAGTPAERRVLSDTTLATFFDDIDRIVFTITVDKLKDPIVATVTRDQFMNNKAVVQINNLPPSKIKIHAVAQKADGTAIVEATGEGTVVPDQVTGINLLCKPRFDTGKGAVRIEMDCWTECGCAEPTPAPSAFVPVPLSIVNFKSIGDPHEEGGNGVKFDNMMTGTFMALRTLTGDLIIEKTQDKVPGGKWAGKTVNNAVAVKSGADVFVYYVYGQRARLNDQKITIANNQTITTPAGLVITRKGTDIKLSTTTQDTITIRDKGSHLDLFGSVSDRRVVHEVRGSLGTYNNQAPTEALRMRNGAKAPDLRTFLIDWYVTPTEDLFPIDEPYIPAGYVWADASPAPSPAATATPKPAATPTPAPSVTPSHHAE